MTSIKLKCLCVPFLAGVLTVSSSANSQPAPAKPTPPSNFSKCTIDASATSTFTYGSIQQYTSCSDAMSSEDYGRVFVKFQPPHITDPNSLTPSERQKLLNNLKRFFLPNTKSADVLAQISIQIGGSGQWQSLADIDIASLSYDEHNGIKFTGSSTGGSNYIGYYFPAASGTTNVRVKFSVVYTNGTTSNILSTANEVTQSLSAIGLISSPSNTVFSSIQPLEQRISQAGNADVKSIQQRDLGYSAGGRSGLLVAFHVEPGTQDDGYLFVGLDRAPSVFPNATVDAGHVKFKVVGWGNLSTGPITDAEIGGQHLDQLISTLATSVSLSDLRSNDPATFRVACQAVWNALRKPEVGLNSSDKLAAFWALFAPLPSATNPTIRQEQCITNNEADIRALGLPLPPPPVVLPAEYQTLEDTASQAAQAAIAAVALARDRANQGIGFANGAAIPGAPQSGTVTLARPNTDSYAGQTPSQTGRYLGVYKRLDQSASGDEYDGEIISAGSDLRIPDGEGVYKFGQNAAAASRAVYAGGIKNGYFSGAGELQWTDGRVYWGNFANDKPNGIGVLNYSNGLKQSGQFVDGLLDGQGVERTTDGTVRFGTWVSGRLIAGKTLAPST